eukprot:CAMPEP_0197456634 /NCGR_PEP_ID=MMETSP1175-20131217/43897_1 /TAXON_ID=1003142 /ORGANISM="Triceratium dubium, Strain CCMP147" /LENGTH=127 /DNA_ID=CAMNT_0042990769 /DNA_START=34 /DNA_END=413 /DNA_ORIENTATION=-
MMARFCATSHALFHAFTMKAFDLASTLLGVLNPFSSRDAMASFTLNPFCTRTPSTSPEISFSSLLVQALVGKAVVPVQITRALASLSAGRRESGQDSPPSFISSNRFASKREILSSRPSKNPSTDDT